MATDLRTLTRARRRLPEPALARDIRVRAGISVDRLAKELGVTWTTIQKWESGRTRPHGDRLVKYVEALELMKRELGVA